MESNGDNLNDVATTHNKSLDATITTPFQDLPGEAPQYMNASLDPDLPVSINGILDLFPSDSDVITTFDNPDLTSKGKAKAKKPESVAGPRYDPKDLISPKAKRHRDALEEKAVDTAVESTIAEDGSVGTGVASLYERLHNVGKREVDPRKRQRLSAEGEEDTDHKATFSGGAKGGILGDEIKRLRDEGAANNGPIDLTLEDDDDDEVTITRTIGPPPPRRLDPAREVCLGMIHAKVNADRVPCAPATAKSAQEWPRCRIKLEQVIGQGTVFLARDGKGVEFGKLDFMASSALGPLMKTVQFHRMRFSAHLAPRLKEPGEQPGQAISKLLDIHITLYASAHSVEGIGRSLSQKNVFLHKPVMVEQQKEIMNPHVPNYKMVQAKASSSARSVQSGYKERTVEEIRSDVVGMFDRLLKSEEMPEMEADSTLVKTDLMSHQKQALYFLTKQETAASGEPSNNLWKSSYEKGNKVWYNVITGHEMKTIDLALGGIFADMMGLGKTLSVLSRICASIAEARSFGDDGETHEKAMRNARATLIVCPKSVLSNWDEQIKAHLDSNEVSYYVYHGSKREQDIDVLAKYDIVITAYTTVGSEFSSSSGNYSAVGKLNWYRVVLDEAHMIRNQDTNVFKAACAISSKRRWAVTGTPIQNRLDDLGALIKFLKIYPFYEKGAFEQHFLAPFKAGDAQVLDNLNLLVGSISLRRSKEKIDLPDRREDIVRLEFSDEERALYEAFAKDSNRKVRAMMSSGDRLRGRGAAQVLTNITRLRALCAHGREMISQDDMKLLEGSSYGTAIELGDEDDSNAPPLSEAQVYDTFYLLRESTMDMCACCSDAIGRSTDGDIDEFDDEASSSDIIGYLTPCLQPICPKCVASFRKELDKNMTRDNYAKCPQCEQYIKAVLCPITQSGVEADTERRMAKKQEKTRKGNDYHGPHTKVRALISDLQAHAGESAALAEIGEAPIRSVVFSGWTHYLDLIEMALHDAGMQFLRLDGKMSVPARSRVLEAFKADVTKTVMLVSIKAGGQGLNFTAASKVFMMEPQFNPGVEMQAVDRVHRLGQRRAVHIKRFIMKDSFEEKIMELQRKKIELANMATGKTKREEAQSRMKELVSLFR
ncbi:hypothetical protein MBLNU459_g7956t1 [Dothideomycetes sp. NU459]